MRGPTCARVDDRTYLAAAAILLVLTGDRWLALRLADVAADRARRRRPPRTEPDLWARRIALNLAHLARLRVRDHELTRPQRAAGRSGLETAADDFWRAVRSLPDTQARAVTLHYLEGLEGQALGAALGVDARAAEEHLFWGRMTLAGLMPSVLGDPTTVDDRGRRAGVAARAALPRAVERRVSRVTRRTRLSYAATLALLRVGIQPWPGR